MTSLVSAPSWPRSVITVDTPSLAFRGRVGEFRHHGIVLRHHTSGTAALLDFSKEPGAIVLIPSDMSDIPVPEFVDLAVTFGRAPVVLGLVGGTPIELVHACLDRGALATIPLPVTPLRLAKALATIAPAPTGCPEILSCGALEVNPTERKVSFHNQPVSLGPKEFQVLELVMRTHPEVAALTDLLPPSEVGDTHRLMQLRVAIGRVRHKFAQQFPDIPPVIETVRGVGYRITV